MVVHPRVALAAAGGPKFGFWTKFGPKISKKSVKNREIGAKMWRKLEDV